MSDTYWLANRPIAHRGLHDQKYPENSIPAFMEAVRHNYPIELDVQLSSDGEIVVFHDYNTFRMTGVFYDIAEVSFSDLSLLRLGKTEYCIPTFEQVLQVVERKVPLLIEIKNEGMSYCLEEMLCRRLESYRGEFAIQSFNPFSLRAVKKICPNYLTGQLSKSFEHKKFIKKIVLRNCWLNFLSKPKFISYRLDDIPSKMLNKARARGLIICCWTVKTEQYRKKAAKYCHNYIFENIRP